MNITEMIIKSKKPKIYDKGSAFMWTDKHISKQLLAIHLNPDIDLASRKHTSIHKTAEWILNSQKKNSELKILDLGCGPGLYSEFFANKGHRVTGVDISKNSIDYATKSATEKKLNIHYIKQNYLELKLDSNSFDLVILIYTDFAVLNPNERKKLLALVHRVLKKGGKFIFDVLKDCEIDQKLSPKNWELSPSGFWKDSPYLLLSESFLYSQEKVILYQHSLIDSNNKLDTYRFWTHFFSQEDLKRILVKQGFTDIEHPVNILPEGDMWNGNNVIFTIASKN